MGCLETYLTLEPEPIPADERIAKTRPILLGIAHRVSALLGVSKLGAASFGGCAFRRLRPRTAGLRHPEDGRRRFGGRRVIAAARALGSTRIRHLKDVMAAAVFQRSHQRISSQT